MLNTAPGALDISGLQKYSCKGGIGTATQNLCNKSWIKHAAGPLFYLWTLQVSNHLLFVYTWQRCGTITVKCSGHEAHDRESWGCHRVIVFWHWSLFFSCSLTLYLSFLSSLQSCLSLSSTPLADSLTGSVPLANHSALIMRIISSHHSPWCTSSISSSLFTCPQPLPINPFIYVLVCLSVYCIGIAMVNVGILLHVTCFYILFKC